MWSIPNTRRSSSAGGRALLVASGLTVAVPAAGQQQEIVVTALPPVAGDSAYDIVTLPRERLLGTASNRIEDVLRDVAGFQQFRRTDSRTANPTSQGATLRAFGGNAASRALVLLDGVPVADPFAGYLPWFALAPERFGAVRVTRGAGAGAFGSGALAGTIELQSADPADLPPVRAEIGTGSRGAATADAIASARLGGGGVSLFGRYDRGGGYIIIPEGQRGPADIPASYRQGSAGVRLAAPLTADTEILLGALGFTDDRVRGVAGNTSSVSGVTANLRLLGHGRWRWEALAYLEAVSFANRVVALDPGRKVATPSLDQYNTPATGIGGKIELRPPVAGQIELRLGTDLRDDRGSAEERARLIAGRFTRLRRSGGHNRVAGVYVEASVMPLPRLTLTGGARLDRWRIAGGFLDEIDAQNLVPTLAEQPAARRGWEPTARGGVAYEVAEPLKLRGAAYLGFRLPTLNELYRPFRVGADATASNSALIPERLRGFELGADLRLLPTLRLGVTAFDNRLRHAVGNVTLGVGAGVFPQVGLVTAGGVYRQRQNLQAIVARGVEVEAHLASARWRLDVSYAYTHARVRASGAAAAQDGLPPAQTPTTQASATLGWTPAAGAMAAVTARYLGPQAEDDLGQRPLRSAATLDAVLDMTVARGLVLILRGENLADTLIEAGSSATGVIDRGTPRTLTIALRVSR